VSYDQVSVATYEVKFSEQRNVIVLAPGVGATTDLQRLNDLLKSILPKVVNAD
jgi:hypothetical protein